MESKCSELVYTVVTWITSVSTEHIHYTKPTVCIGPVSSLVDKASLWGLISKASRARGLKLMVQALIMANIEYFLNSDRHTRYSLILSK